MKSLITGSNGFVGHWLQEHLISCGDEVVPIDIEIDICDSQALGEVVRDVAPDAIYHLAAMTHVGESWDTPREVLRVNVLGTAEVLAAARSLNKPVRILIVSSAEVYGTVQPDQLPMKETDMPAPVTPYAASKVGAEAVALQAFRGYGQPVIVVRPFNHVGPRQSPNFAVSALAKRIVDAGRAGSKSLSVGTLDTRRDFTDVRDVVRAYRLLVEFGDPGSVYNVCTGVDIAISEIASCLLELAAVDLELVTDPNLVRPVDVPILRGDPSKLQAKTGWKPTLSIESTLQDVLDYWMSN